MLGLAARPCLPQSSPRDLEVIPFAAAGTPQLRGASIPHLAALGCPAQPGECHVVRLQVDERDAGYNWVLDSGPGASQDDPPLRLDDNDLFLFRPQDAGTRVTADALPPHLRGVELELHDPRNESVVYLYLVETQQPLDNPLPPLVTYDPSTGRFRGSSVELGFGPDVPEFLALAIGDSNPTNLLDRLKVRARAQLLWGLLTFTRDEGDLSTEVVAWRNGPLRASRRQRQRVRLGWGIRSPAFVTDTFFYPHAAEMPVALRLNHRPTYFFGGIRIEAWLDFRNLAGWVLRLPDAVARPIESTNSNWEFNSTGEWFALQGPERTLLQTFAVSPSLAATQRSLVVRSDTTARPPESVIGETPGVGYRIEGWEAIDAGTHSLTAFSYALPPDLSPETMLAAIAAPIIVRALPLLPQDDAAAGSR